MLQHTPSLFHTQNVILRFNNMYLCNVAVWSGFCVMLWITHHTVRQKMPSTTHCQLKNWTCSHLPFWPASPSPPGYLCLLTSTLASEHVHGRSTGKWCSLYCHFTVTDLHFVLMYMHIQSLDRLMVWVPKDILLPLGSKHAAFIPVVFINHCCAPIEVLCVCSM